jgi:hypothetical protein
MAFFDGNELRFCVPVPPKVRALRVSAERASQQLQKPYLSSSLVERGPRAADGSAAWIHLRWDREGYLLVAQSGALRADAGAGGWLGAFPYFDTAKAHLTVEGTKCESEVGYAPTIIGCNGRYVLVAANWGTVLTLNESGKVLQTFRFDLKRNTVKHRALASTYRFTDWSLQLTLDAIMYE